MTWSSSAMHLVTWLGLDDFFNVLTCKTLEGTKTVSKVSEQTCATEQRTVHSSRSKLRMLLLSSNTVNHWASFLRWHAQWLCEPQINIHRYYSRYCCLHRHASVQFVRENHGCCANGYLPRWCASMWIFEWYTANKSLLYLKISSLAILVLCSLCSL